MVAPTIDHSTQEIVLTNQRRVIDLDTMTADSSIDNVLPAVIQEIQTVLSRIDHHQIESFVSVMARADKVFLYGAGRVGIATRALAMRLTQSGKMAYWIPDDTTPGIAPGDLLIANSGSGGSTSTFNIAQQGKSLGATVATITANPEGKIAGLADVVLTLPAQTFKTDRANWSSILPMGSQFELCLWILQDILALSLTKRLGIEESDMCGRHRNLE
jgi:6-phospho-3-hexuloisomerase